MLHWVTRFKNEEEVNIIRSCLSGKAITLTPYLEYETQRSGSEVSKFLSFFNVWDQNILSEGFGSEELSFRNVRHDGATDFCSQWQWQQ